MNAVASVLPTSPPLIISKDEIDFAIEALDRALEIFDAEVEDRG